MAQGLETDNNYIFTILSCLSEDIGVIWYKKDKRTGFIYDFLIREQFRRKGYGYEVLNEIEKYSSKNDVNQMGLHVFNFNESALSFYKKSGYVVTEQDASGKVMKKSIA